MSDKKLAFLKNGAKVFVSKSSKRGERVHYVDDDGKFEVSEVIEFFDKSECEQTLQRPVEFKNHGEL